MRYHRLVASSLAVALTAPALAAPPAPSPRVDPHLEAAREAARWIEATTVRTANGLTWPADPARPDSLVDNLYSGSPGVMLFLLDLYRVTGDTGLLEQAAAGAEHLLAVVEATGPEADAGLYTGLAGQCFALYRAGRISGRERFLRAARDCLGRIVAAARPVGEGVEWNSMTDIIGGGAGIGLTLLWAHRTLHLDGALETAVRAGDRLLELAIPTDEGNKWFMSPDFPRLMPNFSHGTAGISYFLATLYQSTGEKRFLQGAVSGARYLQSVADTVGATCLIFHDEPDNEDLYYLSWCHGPAGTGRTFYRLYQVTGDAEWLDWTRRTAAGIERSGIPRVRTPGFWNNVGLCCGNAGVADYYLALHRTLGDEVYLERAREMIDDLMSRATVDESGIRWVQAENRVEPENLAAQTGYMQGAAGIGSVLLRLHAAQTGDPSPVVLPDSPFGS